MDEIRIQWINHASYLFRYKKVGLLCDPWIEGRVFNESWALLSKSKFSYEDFKEVTHIWFSHEHPDHFFPPNLKKIPAKYRNQITILFQKTMDRKVRNFCLELGFKEIIEMKALKEYILTDDLVVVNSKVSNDTDSWLMVKTSVGNLLNLNDCVFKSEKELIEISQIAGKIDILLTQFSYASWVGNENDRDEKNKHALEKLEEIARHIAVFKPTYTIPFASFVWFCHEDNWHMNAQSNKIRNVFEFIGKKETIGLVFYPGDEWKMGEDHDSEKSIANYESDTLQINRDDLQKFATVSSEDLKMAAKKNTERSLSKNNRRKLLTFKPMMAYISDHDRVYAFSYKYGLQECREVTEENADIAFHSQCLKYCLDFEWGFDTILVAGTFEKPSGGNFRNVMEYQWIGTLNNKGERMDGIIKRAFKMLTSQLTLVHFMFALISFHH